jgi:hypothetical protein
MLLVLLLTINAFSENLYHKDKQVNPLIQQARSLRDHSLQVETRNVLQQIYANLDRKELEAMRRKLIAVSDKTTPGLKTHEIENEKIHEAVFLFKEAIEKIPGARVTSTFPPKLKAPPRKGWFGSETEAAPEIFLSEREDARAFSVHGRNIQFELAGKLYSISPGILGSVSFHLEAVDAKAYQAGYDKCFNQHSPGQTEKQRQKKCEDWSKSRHTEYRSGENFFTIENGDMKFTVSSTHYNSNKTGDLSLNADTLTNSAFSAVLDTRENRDKLPDQIYLNDRGYEYEFTEDQERRIDEITKEGSLLQSTSPTSAPPAIR